MSLVTQPKILLFFILLLYDQYDLYQDSLCFHFVCSEKKKLIKTWLKNDLLNERKLLESIYCEN